MSTDTLTQQMHESRARRLVDAETRAAAAEAIRKDEDELDNWRSGWLTAVAR